MKSKPLLHITGWILLSLAAQAPAQDSLLDRPQLGGNLLGLRDLLGAHGTELRLESTQFYYGDLAGSGPEKLELGGKTDVFFAMDGQKAGLWPGLFLNVHGEYRYGDASAAAGTLTPVNAAMLSPRDQDDVFGFTHVVLTQAFSESVLLSVGKFNTVDLADRTFLGGRGVEGFMNTSFVAPPIAGRTIPVSTLGAILSVLDEGKPLFNLGILDSRSSGTDSGLDGLDDEELTIIADYTFYTQWGGHTGTHTFSGSYSTLNAYSFDASDYLRPPTGGPIIAFQQSDSWQLTYLFEQYLCEWGDESKNGWGIFGMLAWSDGNPNPFEYSAVLGLGANGVCAARPHDRFGVGLFWNGVSRALKSTVRPLTRIDDEYGVELFYDAAVTPWLHFGADVQFVHPVLSGNDDAIFAGLRSRVIF
ncbi:porin [Haloferula luteola]|uniref:Porin n=1 Tax=Haloferula luteola TaxID=595692 RepID=A0A840V2Q4_9BACT|nr:carbohydrate porin [Haloferula luteola]MBB5352272.1 porin [Haloferula luteola]